MLNSKFSLSRHLEYANKQITYHFWLWVMRSLKENGENYWLAFGGDISEMYQTITTCVQDVLKLSH
jgi:hypothetical protein